MLGWGQDADDYGMPPRKKKTPPPTPVVDTVHPYTTAFADGSSTGGVGAGGWAWAVENGLEDSGGALETTNNRMELLAAHNAMLALPGLLLIVSDSSYVVNAFQQEWWKGWQRRGWVNAAGDPVANRDLWEPFIADYLARNGEVKFAWIKGHAKHPMNEHVDGLAKAAKAAMLAPVGEPVGPA